MLLQVYHQIKGHYVESQCDVTAVILNQYAGVKKRKQKCKSVLYILCRLILIKSKYIVPYRVKSLERTQYVPLKRRH